MLNGLDVNYRYLEHITKAMDKIIEKPKDDDKEVVMPTLDFYRCHIIQDPEKPLCLQCGNPVDVTGNCASCGMVKERMR